MSSTMKKETNTREKKLKVLLDDYPSTWPSDGDIDLNIHDLPHHESIIEWWYQNCHVTTNDGRRFSLFASFFRLTTERDKQTGNLIYKHSVIWSLSDISNKEYYTHSLVDPNTPVEVLKIINKDSNRSRFLDKALKEVFTKKGVPLPDKLLKEHAKIGTDCFSLEYDENSFKKDEQGNYHLTLENPLAGIVCKLLFVPLIKPIRHGNNGFVKGLEKEDMFYYFIPKCNVSGEIQIDNEINKVAGSGWYDHEFSRPADKTASLEIKRDAAWNWLALQLDNGYQISAYDLFDSTTNMEHIEGSVIIIDPDGDEVAVEHYSFSPEDNWTSSRTFITYPVTWRLEIPHLNIFLSITACFPEQEFTTILSMPSFWEGCVDAVGNFMGTEVSGHGYVERNGFNNNETIESFLKAVGKTTQKTVESLLPLNPSDEQFYKLVNSPLGIDFFSNAEKEQYTSSVIKPIREIVDRSKKSWRSYVLLASIDIVGGNSQPFIDWLAMPELIHTGSLIVDDVQDRSDTRRGGATLHHLYGEPLAINAGNACYFIGDLVVLNSKITEQTRLKIYELYFEMMRAAHAGQALDISGLHKLMPDAVNNGDGSALEKRLYTIHRLKTAAPASTLARIGGLLGNGTPEQIDAIGNYFEAAGIAYQIMDDVMNLQGFENNLKDKGEDITAGKITMPVAKAMFFLPMDKREYIWNTIQTMPTDKTIIRSVIDVLQNCGAIDACRQEAESLVEEAWKKIDKIFPDSFYKVKLRAFGWFILRKE